MRLIKRDDLVVRERQRSEPDKAKIPLLKESILSKGLLNPPVVWYDNEERKFILSSGFHRLLAIDEIHEEGTFFTYSGTPILPGEVPVTSVEDLSPADLMEAELEENTLRTDLTWQDRMRAIDAIHKMRLADNPNQTYKETADALHAKGLPLSAKRLQTKVREAVIVSQHLSNPAVAKARNENDAMAIILKNEEASMAAALIQRRKASGETSPIQARQGDALLIMPLMDEGQFDLICTDPPYGIGADKGGFRQRTVEHHNYEDTPEKAKEIMQAIVLEGFRLAKPRANMFVFGDIDLFDFFKTVSKQAGWVPFRTPLHWVKSTSEGLRPWGSAGPAKTVEWIFYATKGQKGLLVPVTDVFDFRRVARNERRYGPEKPIDLMMRLIEISTMHGDAVFDPCCGAGSTLAAARRLKRSAIGIELNEDAYKLALMAADGDEDEAQPAPAAEASVEDSRNADRH